MPDPSDAEILARQERDAYSAAVFDILPLQLVIEHYAVLDMIAHHLLFALRNDTVVRRVEDDVCIHDADIDLLVSTAVDVKLATVLWGEEAGEVSGEDGADTAYPLRLTPLGVEAHARFERYLHGQYLLRRRNLAVARRTAATPSH